MLAAVSVVKDNKIPILQVGQQPICLSKAIETAEDTNGEKVRSVLENMEGFKGLSGGNQDRS